MCSETAVWNLYPSILALCHTLVYSSTSCREHHLSLVRERSLDVCRLILKCVVVYMHLSAAAVIMVSMESSGKHTC